MCNNKDDIKLTDTKSTKLDAERSKREDYITNAFWVDRSSVDENGLMNIYVKTDGIWEFMKKDKPENLYYGCGALNSMET